MITILYGRDDFSAHEALDTLRADLDADGLLADNTTQLEGASARPEELLLHCQTMPFLGNHRLVIVRGLLGRFQSAPRRGRRTARPRKATAVDALGPWQAFIDALPALPETTALVLIDGEVGADNPLLQALRPLARDVREFKPLPPGAAGDWIARRAKHYGLTLEARALALLASLVGTNLRLLDSELRKLATFGAGRTVSADDLETLVNAAREPNVFAMADAVIEGRVRDAVGLLQRLVAEGQAPQYLLTMIARQYRLLLLTKELLEQRVRPAELTTRLRVQNFVLQRLLNQAPIYTLERLRRAYHRLLEADLSVKRGIYDDETALQLLVVELGRLAQADGATPRGRPGYSRPRAGPAPPPPAGATGRSGRR